MQVNFQFYLYCNANMLLCALFKFKILPYHYVNGQLVLRCSAEVGSYYADFTEAPLETTRKEPIPERGKCEQKKKFTVNNGQNTESHHDRMRASFEISQHFL